MKKRLLTDCFEELAADFAARDWKFLDAPPGSRKEKMYCWPGEAAEEIMICVHKGKEIHEVFHRQDFFFFNFAYRGAYGAFSERYDNHIVVREGECYIGQPFAGYALHQQSEREFIIIGVLVQKNTFFKAFLPVLSADAKLFKFFLDPQTDEFSEEFIRLKFAADRPIRALLEMMVMEYAAKKADTQAILKPLVLALFMLVSRQYAASCPQPDTPHLAEKIVQYIASHSDKVSLKEIADKFAYHPNYISNLLRRDLGKSFSEILTEQRMARATALIDGTDLTVEEIAALLGYSNSSNFYKAFREYYGASPRDYARLAKE